MDFEKYVLTSILEPITYINNGQKYILEDDFDNLNLTNNEKKFVIMTMDKYNITLKKELIDKKDRPSVVSKFDYGIRETEGAVARDLPVKAELEYNEYDNLVFESYDDLDEFLEKEFIPENVSLKKKVKSQDTERNLYPFIRLSSIVKLRLSEAEVAHVMEYLRENGIYVRGTNSTIDDGFENYDYYRTYKNGVLPEIMSSKEENEKFLLYFQTKDPVIREQLILSNMRLASFIAYKMAVIYELDIHELESYAYEGLIEAIDRFNPNLGSKFSSYGYPYIKGHILSGMGELESVNRTAWSYGFIRAKKEVESSTGLKLSENPELANNIVNLMVKNNVISKAQAKDFPDFIHMTYCKEELSDIEEEAIDEINDPENIVLQDNLKEVMSHVLDTLAPREKIVIELRYGFIDGRIRTMEEVAREFNVSREKIRQIEAKALRKLRHPARTRQYSVYAGHDYDRNFGTNQVQKTYLDEMIAKHTGKNNR